MQHATSTLEATELTDLLGQLQALQAVQNASIPASPPTAIPVDGDVEIMDSQLASVVIPDHRHDPAAALDPWKDQQLPAQPQAISQHVANPWQPYQAVPSAKRPHADVPLAGGPAGGSAGSGNEVFVTQRECS